MTPILAEISAAPHLPPVLRQQAESHVLRDFLSALSGASEIEVIEDNGELFLVSHPVTTG